MDFFDLQDRWPRRLAVSGIASKPLRIDILVSNVTVASLPKTMFEPEIPFTSRPISLDEIDLARLLAP